MVACLLPPALWGLPGRPPDPAATRSPAPWGAVPRARRGFTAEFGTGSGGAPALWPPGRAGVPDGGRGGGRAGWLRHGVGTARPAAGLPPGRGSSLGRLGPVGCARRRACTPGLSTWWSATALLARPGLAVGFPLRCLQRLSRPRLATRLRGWRHDRSTRGASAPVLSYWGRIPSSLVHPRQIGTELSHDVLNPAHVPL
jgi:hypothetical protein